MIRKSLLALTVVSIGMLAGAGTSDAAPPLPPLQITWHPDLEVHNGSGCPTKADAQVIAFGPDAAVLFRNFGINLQKGPGDLKAIRQCSVRIPATIPNGAYKAQLTQAITYGVNKSKNSDGVIKTLSSFFTLPVKSFAIAIPRVEMQDPGVVNAKIDDRLEVNACNGPGKEGLYRSDVMVSARRDNVNEAIVVATAGLDLRYDVTTVIIRCP